jgi:ABC-type branched-subunit amino acid transport system permease subunit
MALALAILSAGGVFLFLKRTLIGTAVRAASEDPTATTLMGINPNWVNAVAFTLGIALAGVAGVALSAVYSFDPNYGFTFAIKALIALTLGGLGNVYGALLVAFCSGSSRARHSFMSGPADRGDLLRGFPAGANVPAYGSSADRLRRHRMQRLTDYVKTERRYVKIIIGLVIVIAFARVAPFYQCRDQLFRLLPVSYLCLISQCPRAGTWWRLRRSDQPGHPRVFRLGAYTMAIIWLNDITHTAITSIPSSCYSAVSPP